LAPGRACLLGAEAHHLARVLRVRVGDPVQAFDGRGRLADGAVQAIDDDGVDVVLSEPRPSDREAPVRLTVAVALLKGDKLSGVVRQATELGVVRIAPLLTRRADVPRLSAAKLTRLRRVADEAAKQCGRAVVPVVDEPAPLSTWAWEGVAWVADPSAERHVAEVADAYARAPVDDRLTVVTGPEGGFDDKELRTLTERGAVPIGLGPRILRAETAPLTAAAVAIAAAERPWP
ncbi:MAG: 16S rRNA (uracil(1498)-N(3))-methyltransferase, partial [Trueperaceae bacterium]